MIDDQYRTPTRYVWRWWLMAVIILCARLHLFTVN